MELVLIIGFSFLLLIFSLLENDETILHNAIFIILNVICKLIIFISIIHYSLKPQAIDVYKGKTTLEITYKDKVPIDSTVVWKNDK